MKLLDVDFPVFEEAVQTAARFLNASIAFIGIPSHPSLVLRAAIGLSQFGLMDPLVRTRRLPLEEEMTHWVLREQRRLYLPHVLDQAPFAQSCLVQEYGIQAFLGVPLLTAEGDCVGILAVMDTTTHDFSAEAIALVELLARWSVSEYERQQLVQLVEQPASPRIMPPAPSTPPTLDIIRFALMSQLTQDMRNPLTTISGMSSMLSREIYGSLSPKQREYTDIIYASSRRLLEVANELLELGCLETQIQNPQPMTVDVEMVGQQVQQLLMPLAAKHNQEIHLTVEPGSRLWLLDRDLLRNVLYYLLYAVVNLSGEGGTVRVHASQRDQCLNLSIWLVHPWLGEGLPSALVTLYQQVSTPATEQVLLTRLLAKTTEQYPTTSPHQSDEGGFDRRQGESWQVKSRETLSLLLSRYLVEQHRGTVTLQGDLDTGYRFLLILPFPPSIGGEGTTSDTSRVQADTF